MGSLNQWEVEEARDLIAQLTEVPRLQLASRMMVRLVGWVNTNSDGWHSWALPGKASTRLQDKLGSVRAEYIRGDVVDLTQAQLTSLLKPIRSFLVSRDVDPDKVLNDPPPPPPVDIAGNLRTAQRLITEALAAMERQVMTLQFKLGPRNSYGQAQLFIAPALSRTFQNAGQLVLTPDEHTELSRRLAQPTTSETEENGPDTPAPVARHVYDDVAVALTIGEGGVQEVHIESIAVDSTSGTPEPGDVYVRVTGDRLIGGGKINAETLWEGAL